MKLARASFFTFSFLESIQPVSLVFGVYFAAVFPVNTASWLVGLHIFCLLLFEVPCGVIADKMGYKSFIVLAKLLELAGLALLFSRDLTWIALATLLISFSHAAISGLRAAYLKSTYAQSFEKDLAQSQALTILGMLVAFLVIAISPAGLVSLSIWLQALFCCSSMVSALLFVSSTPSTTEKLTFKKDSPWLPLVFFGIFCAIVKISAESAPMFLTELGNHNFIGVFLMLILVVSIFSSLLFKKVSAFSSLISLGFLLLPIMGFMTLYSFGKTGLIASTLFFGIYRGAGEIAATKSLMNQSEGNSASLISIGNFLGSTIAGVIISLGTFFSGHLLEYVAVWVIFLSICSFLTNRQDTR